MSLRSTSDRSVHEYEDINDDGGEDWTDPGMGDFSPEAEESQETEAFSYSDQPVPAPITDPGDPACCYTVVFAYAARSETELSVSVCTSHLFLLLF